MPKIEDAFISSASSLEQLQNICNTIMSKQELYTIKVPDPLPEKYKGMDTSWITSLFEIDGQKITIVEERMEINTAGYLVERFPKSKPQKYIWIPFCWISSKDNICTCTSRDLFNRGCPGH